MLHVMLAGVYVFLTSLTLLVQLAAPELSLVGVGVLTLLGAWAGASSTLRTKESLYAAAAGVGLMLLLALRGNAFSTWMNVWITVVMVPLSLSVWAVVAWRRTSEEAEEAHELRATH